MVRSEPTADAWLAAIRERNRLGIAMAAIIKIIATTINNSISEKPRESFLISLPPVLRSIGAGPGPALGRPQGPPLQARAGLVPPLGKQSTPRLLSQVITQRREASPCSCPGGVRLRPRH